MALSPRCKHKGCGVREAASGPLGWIDGFCGAHAPPKPKAPRALRRSPEEVQAEARAKRAEDHDRLRRLFPGIVIFDVTEAKGPEARAEALLAQIQAHNAGRKP